MERSYYARELVTFVKKDLGKSISQRYMLIGYFNKDKSKFRDVKTGNIFRVVFLNNSVRNCWDRAIEVGGQDFIQIGMRAKYEETGVRRRFINFSDKCVYSKIKSEPFVEYVSASDFPNLYDYVIKKQDSSMRVVSTTNILRAEAEADKYAESMFTAHSIGFNENDRAVQKDSLKLTESELDF